MLKKKPLSGFARTHILVSRCSVISLKGKLALSMHMEVLYLKSFYLCYAMLACGWQVA